jgi:hypothetical protein
MGALTPTPSTPKAFKSTVEVSIGGYYDLGIIADRVTMVIVRYASTRRTRWLRLWSHATHLDATS